MSAGPYEIESVYVNDPTAPDRWARIVRTHHGATVQRRLIAGDVAAAILPETEFDSYERAQACVNRWLHGQEWRW